ncbi:MAG TPA: ABC transporter permease, partial [Bryobacteraceae bacterium]|nr:ABC transporter permease [Bryobacteraceae bacterium]
MSVFRRAERDQEFDEELQSHLQHAIADNIGRGLSPEEARRVALASLGGLDQTRELHRDSRGLPALEAIRRDAAYAVRTLKRDATLTTFAVLIVGLGVGASSTVFSILNTLLLRPLPFSDSDRLVWVANGNSSNLSSQTVQVDNLLDLRSQSRSFDGIEGYSPFYGNGDIRLTGAGEPERLTGVPVTEGFFRLLGVTPELGRLFTPEECRWNAPKTVVLSHRFWQRRFAADPRVVGTSVHLDGVPATVVGVLPATFDFASTFSPGNRADLFTPYPLTPETNAHGNTLALIARLKPHADIKTASAEAAVIGQRINRERLIKQARRNTFGPRVTTLRDRVSGRFQNAALILAGAVTIVMLIVCANVSNLLLVRASARQKEMAIRAALGAGRRQLIRQMLIESTLLACCGGVLGLLLAAGGTSLLAKWDDTAIPLLAHVELDKVAAGFALLLSMLTGLAFGMTPALQISATAPNDTLKDEGRGSTGGKQRAWLRSCFVVAEVAVVCVLLTGAGLLMRSLVQVLNVDLGFESDNVLALRVDPPREYSSLSQRNSYFDQVLRSARD